MIPVLIGLLFELLVIVPMRVPVDESPVFLLYQDWALGLIFLKIWTRLVTYRTTYVLAFKLELNAYPLCLLDAFSVFLSGYFNVRLTLVMQMKRSLFLYSLVKHGVNGSLDNLNKNDVLSDSPFIMQLYKFAV